MKLSTAIILFFIVFMVVQNQKECGTSNYSGPAGGGTYVGQAYQNVTSLDSLAKTIDPDWGRTHSTFHHVSPESWQPGMFPNNKASMLNVGGRSHIAGIPSVPTNTPYSPQVPVGFNV